MTKKVMIPSDDTITAGQIGKIQEGLGAALRKAASLPCEAVQQVIEHQSVALNAELVAAIRKRVEAISGMIFRAVNVNIGCLPKQVLELTGRKQYVTLNNETPPLLFCWDTSNTPRSRFWYTKLETETHECKQPLNN